MYHRCAHSSICQKQNGPVREILSWAEAVLFDLESTVTTEQSLQGVRNWAERPAAPCMQQVSRTGQRQQQDQAWNLPGERALANKTL